MSFYSTAEFAMLTAELTKRLQATSTLYFSNLGLQPLPNTALEQMTVPLEQVSSELLMFGADIWPAAAKD